MLTTDEALRQTGIRFAGVLTELANLALTDALDIPAETYDDLLELVGRATVFSRKLLAKIEEENR